jgi:hypothetical protein
MTRDKALDKAIKMAKQNNKMYYVVYENEEGYQVADDFDMNTFFNGSEIIATVYENGQFDNGVSNEFAGSYL